ncbi:MAG: hypothetical protein ACRC3B_03740 [Bacteroidia bacterium]
MTKKIAVLTFIISLALMSFTGSEPAEKAAFKTGTYSTCSCDDYSEKSLKFGLTLNNDSTFHYFDYSNSANKIDIRGNWVLSKNKILLKDYPANSSLESKWVIDNNGKCLKSNSGLSFTRICNVSQCD